MYHFEVIILKNVSHSFCCFLSSGILPSQDSYYAARQGAGNFFEVFSQLLFGDTQYWPIVKVAASLYANDDIVESVGLLSKSITAMEGTLPFLIVGWG